MLSRFATALIFVMTLALAGAGSALAERRVALVIGNSAYENAGKLPNPINDAEDITAALKKLNFEVIVEKNLNKRGMDEAFRKFARAVGGADVALFYYAGHAMQFAGVNYLMPTDAKLKDEADLRYEMAKVDDIVDEMKRAKGVRIIVLDSCRDNPLEAQLKQRAIGRLGRSGAATRGLAAIDGSAEGMLIAFATAAGSTADDGDTRNSPFTAAFLKHIETPGLEVSAMFKRIRAEVFTATGNRQRPDVVDSLIGDFAFKKGNPNPGFDDFAWGLIKDTQDPTALERFISQFPQSPLRKDAEERLARLKSSPRPVSPGPTAPPPVAVAPQVRPPLVPGLQPLPSVPRPTAPPPVVALADPRGAPPSAGSPADLCDRLAGSQSEADRAPGIPGVDLARIDANRAIPACQQAVASNPGIKRFAFNLARAQMKAGDFTAVRNTLTPLISANHPGAMAAMGSLFENGQGGLPRDDTQAREWYVRAAEGGSPLGMFNIGNFYDAGRGGLPRNFDTARSWYMKAASAGLPEAMTAIGEYHMDGIGVPKNDAEARQWFERAAQLNDPRAMVNIGFFFEHARGGYPQDDVQARSWYERAAARGHPVGLANLGVFYEFGRGGSKDIQQARALYERAGNLGNANGMTNLGWLLESGQVGPANHALARQWYERAANLGNNRAMTNLAFLLETGRGGAKDLPRAIRLYTDAANRGYAPAMSQLGDLYEDGTGVEKNEVTARQWFEKAAAAGSTNGMTSLGYYYANALGGLPRNYQEAVRWYERAANQGGDRAMNNLGVLYENGNGVPQSFEQARQWYQRAAEKNNRFAMNNLGVLLEKGQGGPKDLARAYDLYHKSANLGHGSAMFNIALLYANGVHVQKDDVQARAWYEKAINAGNLSALFNLALLYEAGRGGPADLTKAREYFDRAAKRGHAGAMDSLGVLLMRGRGGPVDAQRAASLFLQSLRAGDKDARRRLITAPASELTADVRLAVQSLLQREGLGTAVDGNFGPGTLQALETYAQRR